MTTYRFINFLNPLFKNLCSKYITTVSWRFTCPSVLDLTSSEAFVDTVFPRIIAGGGYYNFFRKETFIRGKAIGFHMTSPKFKLQNHRSY